MVTTFLCRKNLFTCVDEPEIIPAKERDEINCHCEAGWQSPVLIRNEPKIDCDAHFTTAHFIASWMLYRAK